MYIVRKIKILVKNSSFGVNIVIDMKMTSPGSQQKAIIGSFGAGILYKSRLLEDVSCTNYFFKPKVWRV